MMTLTPLYLSLALASITTVILLMVGTPIAWWLSQNRSWFKVLVESFVALPIILPPTVLGFYLLVAFHVLGQTTGVSLAFTFQGLVVGSILYSLPFVVRPLQQAFESVPSLTLEAASTLRASRWDRFFSIVLPQTRRGFLSAIVLGFAHTLGEFGVVLMIGGSIPGKTQVLSVAIYHYVEQLQYHLANAYSLGISIFSLIVLFILFGVNRHYGRLSR
jgi:molybdate transport system permease protein